MAASQTSVASRAFTSRPSPGLHMAHDGDEDRSYLMAQGDVEPRHRLLIDPVVCANRHRPECIREKSGKLTPAVVGSPERPRAAAPMCLGSVPAPSRPRSRRRVGCTSPCGNARPCKRVARPRSVHVNTRAAPARPRSKRHCGHTADARALHCAGDRIHQWALAARHREVPRCRPPGPPQRANGCCHPEPWIAQGRNRG